MEKIFIERRKLDEKDRCCGRKPIIYKKSPFTGYFCTRCYRSYDLKTKIQIENWAYPHLVDGKS